MTFIRLDQLIPQAASKHQLSGELRAAMVISRAGTIVKELFPNPNLFGRMRVKRLKAGILWIAVDSSIVAEEVQKKAHLILQRLNDSLEKPIVQQVRSFQEMDEAELYL